MKKMRLLFLLVMCLFISSCTGNGNINNSTTNKTVYYEDVDISSLQDGLEMAIEKGEQSVVSIEHYGSSTIYIGSKTIGSGVITKKVNNNFSKDYYVLTNRHVIMHESGGMGRVAKTIKINIKGYEYEASYISHDLNVDLAIIKFTSSLEFKVAEIDNSASLKRGHLVVAIGTPYSTNLYGSVTMGIVSYNGRSLEDEIYGTTTTITNTYIQHDASINPGNSGGGLFNINGKLIGINTSKIMDEEAFIEGIGFAIPTQVIMQLYSQYLNT